MALSQDQLDLLEYYKDEHDRIGYYATLASFGVSYGNLALGVVTAEDLSGATANVFLKSWALSGSVAVSDNALVELSIALMEADFAARRDVGDLGWEQIQDYHNSVFSLKGIPEDAWTVNIALNTLATNQERDDLWADLVESWPVTSFVNIVVDLLSTSTDQIVIDYLEALTSAGVAALVFDSNEYGAHNVTLADGTHIIGDTEDSGPLSGTAGNDVISGFAGEDTIAGGSGNDVIYGGQDNDVIDGGDGDDWLDGGVDDDTLNGGLGNDGFGSWIENDGDDYMYGGDGEDFFYGIVDANPGADAGTDVFEGGVGDDIAQMDDDGSRDIILVGQDTDIVLGGGEHDRIAVRANLVANDSELDPGDYTSVASLLPSSISGLRAIPLLGGFYIPGSGGVMTASYVSYLQAIASQEVYDPETEETHTVYSVERVSSSLWSEFVNVGEFAYNSIFSVTYARSRAVI